MVYLVEFEADVQGIASVKRITGTMLVYGKDVSTAKHFAESVISDSYSDDFAIISIVPQIVYNMT